MMVSVLSYIPWLQQVNGEYQVDEGTTVYDLLHLVQEQHELDLQWDRDALVGINNRIAKATDILQASDQVVIMMPLNGG
ncbi:MoaD/ThiS family protein [Effusibacillus dendaii]|uniref:Molybdopterin synthase sulfur carrier subunit n=1 Tax=Effusibacillus dendaii TaxID=2743772 RepID=A0A7I8D917_9BACL|nr:MoaD/ThiS family protein [Effusibacillus dendaii]BCJ85489.1 hypothetical protein skT53_04740 [Effusibacillus dendaii]